MLCSCDMAAEESVDYNRVIASGYGPAYLEENVGRVVLGGPQPGMRLVRISIPFTIPTDDDFHVVLTPDKEMSFCYFSKLTPNVPNYIVDWDARNSDDSLRPGDHVIFASIAVRDVRANEKRSGLYTAGMIPSVLGPPPTYSFQQKYEWAANITSNDIRNYGVVDGIEVSAHDYSMLAVNSGPKDSIPWIYSPNNGYDTQSFPTMVLRGEGIKYQTGATASSGPLINITVYALVNARSTAPPIRAAERASSPLNMRTLLNQPTPRTAISN